MTMTPIKKPVRTADMDSKESEAFTQVIKQNFDCVEAISTQFRDRETEEVTHIIKETWNTLKTMLVEARERKAHTVLNYKSFEDYCECEFDKSASEILDLEELHKGCRP